jgi:signal transduction histidine kinase
MEQSDTNNYFRDLYELDVDDSLTLAAKIERAITIGRDRLDVQYGVLSYTGSGEYEVIDSTVSSGLYVAESVHDLETTWCRHVVGDRDLLAVADAGESAYHDDAAREETGLQCYIGAPVLVDGETYGTLCYSGEQPRGTEFTDDEKRFVRLLTRWVGHELEREKHYRALDAQNRRLNEFAGALVHDLRNPLTSARGYTELVSESVSGADAEHLRTALDALDRMDALITETLSLAREGADVGKRESVQLGDVARTAWETVDPAAATLRIEADRAVRADRSRLRQLFENLFRNVDEHCDGHVTATVRGSDDGFVVADDGPGLPPAVADSVFGDEFDSDEVGLGLLVVERVVSGHGWHGTVDVEDGTRFVFEGVGVVTEKPATR